MDRALRDRTQPLGWRHDHRLRMEGLRARRRRLSHARRRVQKQQLTRRDGYDFRQQYPLVNGAFDPREATFDRFDAWYGEPELKQYTAFANAGVELGNGAKLYGWASYQSRDARSAGFFRRALDDRNTIQIYPDGFLPIIAPDVTDFSGAGGVAWTLGEWDMDSSLVYGKNEMEFTIENTLNRSQGTASQTQFDAGGFDYDELVFNFSGVRKVDVAWLSSALNVATGLEARRETYSISRRRTQLLSQWWSDTSQRRAHAVRRSGISGISPHERRR